MTDPSNHSVHERPLVVLLWHRHSAEIAVDRLAWLAEVDHVMALGAGFAEFTIEGVDIERLDGSVTQLPEALKKVQADFPQSDVLLFRSGLQAPANFVLRLRALIKADERPDQLVFPGNYSVEHAESIDPLLGLGAFDEDADPDSLVSLCGDRRWQWSNAVPLDCLLLRAEGLAERADRIGLSRAALVDDFYIVDPSSPESTDRLEEAEPPLGHVRLRASELRRAGVQQLPVFRPDQQAVTLHIAHSWGGGVWRWIEDFIEGDRDSLHLVLVAVSDGPGQRCGRRLQLCALGPGRGVIREYELSPDITSTSTAHAGYDEHLRQVIERFGVGRIIVSSLIGHSLECLKTGLPTLQVLHDFYPLWPFLDYDPLPMIEAGRGIDFDRAFERYGRNMRLRPRLPEFWQGLTEAWRECIDQHAIALIAPTEHVIQRWQSMNPTMQLTIALEPHGFRPFSQAVESCEPDIDQPLHLLILGRLTTGKGLNLLKKALPELREQARLTALGCGREAFSLLGESGIDLIPNYRRDELPQLVSSLRPQAALLLSTVPETWNYTLSEIRALKLLPIATNIGSFRERIEHGVDGFLIEPQADALIDQVQGLVEQLDTLPEMIEQAMPERSLADQAGAISTRIPAHFGQLPGYRAELADQAGLSRLAADLADARASALLATKQQAEMRAELAARSQWANTMERQFRQRSQWAEQLNRDNRTLQSELSDSQQALVDQVELQQQTQQALNQTTQVLNKTTQTLEQRSAERERLQQLVDQMMASRSWRITRPLRVLNRLRHSPVLPRLFNPLNWPELVGKFFHHCRLRGLKQTLWMLQNMPQPEPEPAMVVETAVPQAGQIAEPLAFPPVEQPLISVVIPVHNQLHYTAACLHSVADAVSSSAFEVIVVNDASNDDTRRWLKRCSGITVLNNRENLGFIGSCNRGAAAACGEYLVFLNNDTKVIDHWLDRMLDLFQQPDTGIVGARLVYADGSLQEAGGVVFSDGSGWNYGRNDEADRPQYSFVSETDYVSGACLMLRRTLFESLNGFDSYYSPAYYEDTDLCFRVRAQGLKVMYQPAATVVHFEGVTSGTDESGGTKRYQVINREKFIQRWQAELSHQPESPPPLPEQAQNDLDHNDVNPSDRVRQLRYHRFAKRALIIDAVTPTPDQDSGSVRMFALLKLFGQIGYQTSFMPSNLAWAGVDSVRLQQAGIEVLTAPWVNDVEEWLVEHGRDLNLVLVSRHYILTPLIRLIRHYCPNAQLLFDTVDLHFLREEREAEVNASAAALREAARTRRAELSLIERSDATLVVSGFEARLLNELKPEARVQVVSNVHSLQSAGNAWADRRDVLFVGGFQHPPNRDAAFWLIEEILPQIREHLPEVKLHLIGSKMPDAIRERRAPGLIVHGFVADLEPYLNTCRVSLAPLRYGAGVKGKVNQAMSHGLPVVATTCAAEGMYTRHEHDVLMADTADDFAEQVVRLYQDQALWEKIAANGRDNVEQHFSVAAAERALSELLRELES